MRCILARTVRDFSGAGIFVIRVSNRSSHCFSKLNRRFSSGISTVWTRTSNSSPTWIWSASMRMLRNFSRSAAGGAAEAEAEAEAVEASTVCSDSPMGCSVASSPAFSAALAICRWRRRSSRGDNADADGDTASIPIVKNPASPSPASPASPASVADNAVGGARILISSIGRFSGIPIYAKLMYIISSSGYVRISIISSSKFVIKPVIMVGISPPNRISTHVDTTKLFCLAYPLSSGRLIS